MPSQTVLPGVSGLAGAALALSAIDSAAAGQVASRSTKRLIRLWARHLGKLYNTQMARPHHKTATEDSLHQAKGNSGQEITNFSACCYTGVVSYLKEEDWSCPQLMMNRNVNYLRTFRLCSSHDSDIFLPTPIPKQSTSGSTNTSQDILLLTLLPIIRSGDQEHIEKYWCTSYM